MSIALIIPRCVRMAPFAVVLLSVVQGLALGAPSGNISRGFAPPWHGPRPAEPAAGHWRTWLLPSGRALRPSAPPPRFSEAYRAELQELVDLQSHRTPERLAAIVRWDAGPATDAWTGVALDLIRSHKTSPPRASRLLALVHVAMYDATVAAWDAKYAYRRPYPSQVDRRVVPAVVLPSDPSYPSEHAAVAAAASRVLAYIFPDEADALEDMATEAAASRLWAGASTRSDITVGAAMGNAVADLAIARGLTDDSDAVWQGEVPQGPGLWVPTPPGFAPPLEPMWGTVKTWIVGDVVPLRPGPPPAVDSPEFAAAVAEVKAISLNRTPEMIAAVQYWAGGAGTVTPPGLWDVIAQGLVQRDGLSLPRTARLMALLNAAQADAFICCWDAKYHYWLERPITADPTIETALPTPPFPSYTSGHSTVSGAASVVLAAAFPDDAESLAAMATEASLSRLWGGIHYRFDCDAGLAAGQGIGAMAVKMDR